MSRRGWVGRVAVAAVGWLLVAVCFAAEPVSTPAAVRSDAPVAAVHGAAEGRTKASPAPARVADPLAAGSVLNVVLSLLMVLAAIWGVAWVVRRMSLFQAPAGGALRLLGGLAVGQRERVVLVQVGDTQLLIGVAPGEVRALHVLEKPVEVPPVVGEGFAERLAQVIGQRAAQRREAE
ncbi:flagellar biosynthetic protein FliO [Endothiovibrio diazotrophicus]